MSMARGTTARPPPLFGRRSLVWSVGQATGDGMTNSIRFGPQGPTTVRGTPGRPAHDGKAIMPLAEKL